MGLGTRGHGNRDGDGVGDGTCSTHHARGRCLQHPSGPTRGPRTLSSTLCPLLAASPLLVRPVADPTAGISLREKDLEAALPKQLRAERPPGVWLATPRPYTGLPAVIATMRDLSKKGKLEEAAGPALGKTLSIQRLDVCSDGSVAECLSSVPGGRVDVLVNNAGVGHVGPVESISVEEMKRVFETNFFGAVRMIKAVLPEMKRRRSGHIVVVSSVMGLQGEAPKRGTMATMVVLGGGFAHPEPSFPSGIVFNDVYAASKFAVEGFCESLAVQLLQFNVL
ncbi:retinol dehydrogenase 8 [Aix galericulata]|nr:retinol dehydrogenase 8 [Aix galericulata]